MKILQYVLQIYILRLNYCSAMNVKKISRYHLPRVWNGKPAELGQFPYQVALARIIKPVHQGVYAVFCGGAIIGESKVLTAAHCLAPDDKRTILDKMLCEPKAVVPKEEINGFRIVAGNIKTFTRSSNLTYQWRSINSYNHPAEYNFPELDVCVLITNKPWEFNENVGSLPYASKHIDYGDRICTASGFGLLNKDLDKPIFSETLMWVNLRLLTQAACKNQQNTDMKDFVCTENKNKDVTPGDSGGALVCKETGDPREGDKGIIVGIVCGESQYGNYFTRISSYTKFVDSALKIACPQFCIFIGLTVFLLNP